MANTPVLGMPLMASNQTQKHVTHNNALLELDVLVQLTILDRNLTTPPGSPDDGDRYIVGAGATGIWDSQDDRIAAWIGGSWKFFTPKEGWTAYILDESQLVIWDGSDWVDFTLSTGGGAMLFGINATADTTNRLSVKSDGILFSHDDVTPGTGDMAVTINKSAAADDGGFYFQTNFSTRAVFGLMGDDDFSIRVSPDGSSFYQAVSIDKDTGHIGLGSTADSNNRLLVSGESMLFTNNGDLRFTFNKGASGDDAALTFQSGFSARALVGLLGDDDFTFKVSPDGSSFYSSFVLDKDNGQISFKQLMGVERAYPSIDTGTLDITSSYVNIQNSGTINTFNGGFDGAIVFVQATGGSVTITNSDNIKTPGATNLVLNDWNDCAIFICNGGGTWICAGVSQN